MATNSNFTPIVEAALPGAPKTEKVQVVEQPDIVESSVADDPKVAEAACVQPQITSALTGE